MFTRNLLTNIYETIVICLGQRSTVERTVQYIHSNGSSYSCIQKCVHKKIRVHYDVDVTFRDARGIGGTEYLESARIEREHTLCHHNIHDLYMSVFHHVCVCSFVYAATRVHACVRSISAVAEAPAMLQTEAESPLFPSSSSFSSSPTSVPSSNRTGQSGGICIHTTSHTHGPLISPATAGN